MITKLLEMLTHTNDRGETEDGACVVCDHPFGKMNHLCFGPLSAASERHLVA